MLLDLSKGGGREILCELLKSSKVFTVLLTVRGGRLGFEIMGEWGRAAGNGSLSVGAR